jgi:hypothetical protein
MDASSLDTNIEDVMRDESNHDLNDDQPCAVGLMTQSEREIFKDLDPILSLLGEGFDALFGLFCNIEGSSEAVPRRTCLEHATSQFY